MLVETLAGAARRFASAPAVVADDEVSGAPFSLSFTDLDRLSDEAAVGLSAMGVGEGDVVALVLPAVPEHFVAYLATAKLGAVTAAVNGRLTPSERQAVLVHFRPTVVVCTADLEPGARGLDRTVVHHVVPAPSATEVLSGLRRPGEAPDRLAPDDTRPVVIVHTSGTTGTPKGAQFSGRQLRFITECDVGPTWGGGGAGLAGPALAHLGPMTKFPGVLRRGTTQHLMATWQAAKALAKVAEARISALGGVPTQVALMLREPTFDAYDLSSLRAIVMGGGPAQPALVRQARRRFKVPVAVRYSCTEAGIGTGTGFDDPEEDALVSVGRPQPGVTCTVVDQHGAALPPGEVGQVCLASAAVMDRYVGDPASTEEVMAGPFGVHTGDLGMIDDQGRLRLAGRAGERYVRGGYNVHPMEVEAVLGGHPEVATVAVVARQDPVMGEIGVAVVVPERGRQAPDLEELRSFAAPRLARYKLPEDLVVLDALPLTAMEKVDRRALEDLVAATGETKPTG